MLVGRPEETLHAHALFSRGGRPNGQLQDGPNGSRQTCVFLGVSLKLSNLSPSALSCSVGR
jgi:hypothetical protein